MTTLKQFLKTRKFQSVVIHFTNGKCCEFVGLDALHPSEIKDATVSEIEVSFPTSEVPELLAVLNYLAAHIKPETIH